MLLRLSWIALLSGVLSLIPLYGRWLPLAAGLVVTLSLAVAGTLLAVAAGWSAKPADTHEAEDMLMLTLVIEGMGFVVMLLGFALKLM